MSLRRAVIIIIIIIIIIIVSPRLYRRYGEYSRYFGSSRSLAPRSFTLDRWKIPSARHWFGEEKSLLHAMGSCYEEGI
jgi:hypothetical protein